MSAIEASSVKVTTMADGTLRITCDIEPRHAQDAFRLFGRPGTPMALAALKPTKLSEEPGNFGESDIAGSRAYAIELMESTPDKPKGGPLSQDAARICQTPEFQEFVAERHAAIGIDVRAISAEGLAAEYVRGYCNIKSRAELDHDARGARLFARLMAEYREAA